MGSTGPVRHGLAPGANEPSGPPAPASGSVRAGPGASGSERLRLKERRVLRIPNPFVGPETPFGDRRLWFDPATYR
jgi:hypothetical protein